jgi:hypothetical protein
VYVLLSTGHGIFCPWPTYPEDAQACLDERQAQIAALVRMVVECRPAFAYKCQKLHHKTYYEAYDTRERSSAVNLCLLISEKSAQTGVLESI